MVRGSFTQHTVSEQCKKELQEKIASETGIQWDIPDKTGKGGTTTTGNIARELLHSRRAQIISELPSNYQDIFSYYGQDLSVILRVMSSKEKVNVDLFKDFCTDLYVFLLTSFKRVIHTNQPGPWISFTPTLHKVLAHSWELIALNDGVGLGALDESGLEGCNKILRNVRTNIAMKTCQKDNLVDTVRRMWVSSDPVVNYKRNEWQPRCKM